MTEKIIIENDGPIRRFEFTVPKEGGVVELLGWNGVGKSHALNAIQQTISGGKQVPARDGTAAAEVEVFGVTARFGRRTMHSGELECEILDSKFDIGDIIDPSIKNAEAADAKRIKALIQLATGEDVAKPELFYKLLPGGQEEFEQEVSLRAQAETDVVNMAALIKRDLEAAARRDAELAEKAQLAYAADKAAVADIDISVLDDETLLAAHHEEAIKSLGQLEAEASAINESKRRASEAQQKLNAQALPASIPSEIEFVLKRAEADLSSLTSEKTKLEQRLEEVKTQIELQSKTVENLEVQLASAAAHRDLIAAWQADIDAAKDLKLITDEQLDAARSRVDGTRAAIEAGALARRAKSKLVEAETNKKAAKELKCKADNLRKAAQAVDNVLSEIVQQLDCPLRVSRGRLVTYTDRGEEVFDDLSDGERVKLVMQIAIKAVKQPGRNGLLVIDQRHWQDLNPANRKLIGELVEGTGVVIVTARATDDPALIARQVEVEPALEP